jgi:cupin fold WbuC family metalloprotein
VGGGLSRAAGAGVTYLEGETVTIGAGEVAALEIEARTALRRRARLCAHGSPDDPVHEMLIALRRDSYVRPHKHLGKPESLLVVGGTADAVFFDDDGALTNVIPLGPPGSGRTFYYRVRGPLFHTLVVRTPLLVYQEVTRGPFRPEDTVFASWSPADVDTAAARRFAAELRTRARAFVRARGGRGPR